MPLSADDIDRNDCLAMIRRAEEDGVPLSILSRRTGRLELELRRLLGDCCRITEQYEAGRGTVYYWSWKSRHDGGTDEEQDG